MIDKQTSSLSEKTRYPYGYGLSKITLRKLYRNKASVGNMFTLLIFTGIMLLVACGPTQAVTSPPIPTEIVLPSVTSTNLPLPTSTAISTPESDDVTQDCLNVLSSPPANLTVEGIIPLEDFQTRNTSFLNLETGDKEEIPSIEKPIAEFAVSPDRKTLAYKVYAQSGISLTLTDAFNSHRQTIFSRKADYALYYWLNNEKLVLGKNGQWVIFNPYNLNEKSYTTNDFPDFDTDNFRNNFVAFESTASRAVYKNGYIFLLNMDSKQIIAEIPDDYDRTPIVDWSPNTNDVAIVGATRLGQYIGQSGDDIFGVAPDGQVTQLTHLAEHYGKGFNIHSLSWSPDSRFIAFWMWYPGTVSNNWVLGVLNMDSKKVTDYCIPTDPYASSGQVLFEAPAPIWSPDGRQIIVEHRTNDSSDVVLVDIDQDTAFQIAQNAVPLGWMLPNK